MIPEEVITKATGLMPIVGKGIIEALTKAGYVIVPKEATEVMIRDAMLNFDLKLAPTLAMTNALRAAMIAASQTQESPPPVK